MKKTGGDIEGYGEDEEVLVYHYGKPGERLKNADPTVKQFYAGEGPQPPKGIFRSLVQTRASRLLLATVLGLFVFTLFNSLLTKGESYDTISGVKVSLSAFSFEDKVFVSVKFEDNEKYQGDSFPVYAKVSFYDSQGQLYYQEESSTFYTGKETFLRTSLTDYDILYVESEIIIEPESSVLRSEVVYK